MSFVAVRVFSFSLAGIELEECSEETVAIT
jgi:hypothetical protein